MKYVALLLLLAVAGAGPGVKPEIHYFRYERRIENAPQTGRQTCVAVDPAIFAHAAPGLADLRVYQGTVETPYVLRKAEPMSAADGRASLLNPGRREGRTVFDAAMPAGAYRDVQLSITGQNFIATVEVSGSQTQAGTARTHIGSYTIFDLTREKLGRSTVLHLPRSDFQFLHFRIEGPIAPGSVKGVTVLRMASSAPKYVTVAASSDVIERGRDTVIAFTVPAHTPVDRVLFVPGMHPADFSREVRIQVRPASPPEAGNSEEPWSPMESYGNLLRIHRVEEGHRLNEERLSVAAPPELSDVATRWIVTIENGDDRPIVVNSVRLEMVERELCFHAAGGATYLLYYGDSALGAPQYDYATLFTPQPDAVSADTGPERANPVYESRPDTRPFTEKHPGLLWAALLMVLLLLAAIAVRSAKGNRPGVD